ncbi:MAG: ATP-dependent helicase [Pseudomonadales bacterium]
METNCTDQQVAAAEHGVRLVHGGIQSGPQLIIAGAGTGKTNTLAHRAAYLILNGVDPKRILLMTFSRRAAQELSARTRRIVNQKAEPNKAGQAAMGFSWMGTFHSIANRILRQQGNRIGLSPDFSIMDRSDAADMIDIQRHKLGYSGTHKRFPTKNTCVDIYSRCVNAQVPIDEVLKADFPWCMEWEVELKLLFKSYVQDKHDQLGLDYDDLLLFLYHLSGIDEVAADIRGLFEHVLVDEYQDTNRLQAGLLLRLFPDGKGLTVVGDDAQSIYSFRSADVDNILSFPDLFSPPAKVYPLSENFRSVQPILNFSNAVLSDSAEGYKNLLTSKKSSATKPRLVTVEDAENQSNYIIDTVLEARESGTELKKQAVLYRTSYHADQLEIELKRRNIPYVKHGGLKFLETAHVKDALCVLRWADNPKHRISGFRVLKLLKGVGPKLADKILDHLELYSFDVTKLAMFKSSKLNSEEWHGLVKLLDAVHNNKIEWHDQMKEVALWYQPILETRYSDPYSRGGDIEQLTMISLQSPGRERFLSELVLDPPSKSGGQCDDVLKDDDYLILSTVHSAKGQEYENVFIINVADGNFPNEYAAKNPKDMEEERRLFYVAITRARENLHVIQPLKYWVPEQQRFGGRHVYGAKSRFLTEQVVKTLEEVPYPDTRLSEIDKATGERVLKDIRSHMLGMWD